MVNTCNLMREGLSANFKKDLSVHAPSTAASCIDEPCRATPGRTPCRTISKACLQMEALQECPPVGNLWLLVQKALLSNDMQVKLAAWQT